MDKEDEIELSLMNTELALEVEKEKEINQPTPPQQRISKRKAKASTELPTKKIEIKSRCMFAIATNEQ